MSYGTTELPYTAARIKGIIKATGQITVKPAGLAGIQLDCNGATGDFTASITPANLTGNRRWTLPNRDDTFAGLGAQTFTGIQLITNATASTSAATGAHVVTGGVGIGGALNVASEIKGNGIFSTDSATSQFRLLPGGSVGVLDVRNAANSAYLPLFLRGSAVNIDQGNVVIGTDPGGSELMRVGGTLAVNSATLIKTYTTLTDGAAAAVGTLTNAPTAGNPTKWVLINDNGVIRKFPTWT